MDRISPPRHAIERLRSEPRRRQLSVSSVETLSPRMLRVHFTSPELADFVSLGADDHIKLFLPTPQGAVMRDFTPRRFDPAGLTLAIDFALHEAGPATRWAAAARPGDTLTIGGPRGSLVVPDDFDWYLLVGDETALPAIARRLEELRLGVPVTTIVLVNDPAEVQAIQTRAQWTPIWLFRAQAAASDAALVHAAVKGWRAPEGEGYVFVGAEASIARQVKTHMLEVRHHNPAWLRASGYWVKGEAGASEK